MLIRKTDTKKKQMPIKTKNRKTTADKSKSPTQRYNKMMNSKKEKTMLFLKVENFRSEYFWSKMLMKKIILEWDNL